MTGTPEPGRRILLFPLEDTDSGPLRRWLGRQEWLSEPVATLRYEPDGDRIMFRLVDAPSVAWGVLDTAQPVSPVGDFFLGFDGTDGEAWPTTIALLDFGQHQAQQTSQFGVIGELVGGEALAAACALRLTNGDGPDLPVRVSPAEAARLIRRWGDLVTPGEVALEAAISEWSGSEWPGEPASSRPGGHGSAGVLLEAQRLLTTSAMSRQEGQERTPSEDGRAERHLEEPTAPHAERRPQDAAATGGGAEMARGPRQPADDSPLGPIPYGIMARLADMWAARRDGNADVPRLPSTHGLPDPDNPRHGITPYLEVRNREFRESAEREKHRMLSELRDIFHQRAELQQQIAGEDAKAYTLHQFVANMPQGPAEPDRRNVLELHLPESLVRARRQREHLAEKAKLVAQELEARNNASELRAREARLAETIAHRERQMHARVRQILEYSLRRCGTYMHHIVHHHPDSGAVIPYLRLALPSEPDWLPREGPPEQPKGALPGPQDGPDPLDGSGYGGSPNGHQRGSSSAEEENKDANA
jgi:hypothetical protein